MTEKELRHLSRRELLEILIDQAKEISSLQDTIRRLQTKLNERKIKIAESGSMAEASLKLNGLFDDADKAVRQYLENARLNEEESRRVLTDARKKAERIIAEAEEIRNERTRENESARKLEQISFSEVFKETSEMSSNFDE